MKAVLKAHTEKNSFYILKKIKVISTQQQKKIYRLQKELFLPKSTP